MNQIRLLEKTWKIGSAVLVSSVLTFGGLFVALSSTSAAGEPHMTAAMFVNDNSDNPDAGWQHSLNSQAGRRLSFTVEVHNTVVGSEANDVKVAVDFPDGTKNNLNIPVHVSSSNANNASDSVTVNVTNPAQGAEIKFVPNSTRLYWDRDGDGTKEFNNTPLVDGIEGNGITLGKQKGCNDYIIQLTFMGELVGTTPQPTPTPSPTATPVPTPTPRPSATPTPTPTPTPRPTPTPTPTPRPTPTPTPSATPSPTPTPTVVTGGNNTNINLNNNESESTSKSSSNSSSDNHTEIKVENKIENVGNPTVNVTTTSAGTVEGVKIPLKTPDTGVGVLGMATMFGAAPLGFALSRYGRGRIVGKREETVDEIANSIFTARKSKKS